MLPDGYTEIPPGKIATIITSLHMSDRTELRPELPDSPWTLRRVDRPDLSWYRDLYRRVGEDWLWFSRLQMSDDSLRQVVHHSLTEVRVLELNGDDEGLLELDFREEGECELSVFGLTAPLIGKGAGRWLMNRALELAWSRPVKRVWLHTCTLDHPGALQFYLRSGFIPFRRQIEVGDDPRITGQIQRTAPSHIPLL